MNISSASSKEDLLKALHLKKRELFNLRFKLKAGSLENTSSLKSARRELARLNTFLNNLKRKN